jgi:hypothetical protein
VFSDAFFLSKRDSEWFTDLYLSGADLAADDARVSPLNAADLLGWRRLWRSPRASTRCATRVTNTLRRCGPPASAWIIGNLML